MGSRKTNLLALAVTVVGLLLGPGYLGYCMFLGGSTVGTRRLQMDKPLTLQLSPDMNPIHFIVVATFDAKALTRDQDYSCHAVLAKNGRAVWEERFSVTRPKKSDTTDDSGFQIHLFPKSGETTPIRTFSVDRAGEFTFTVRLEGRQGLPAGVGSLLIGTLLILTFLLVFVGPTTDFLPRWPG